MIGRKTRDDLGIDLNAPTETIDSPQASRYNPVSFEGQIRAEEERKASKASIVGDIASIILYDNDFKKQEVYAKHQQDLHVQKIQDELDRKNLERDLAVEQGNIVSDRIIEHESRVTEAMQKADADVSLSRTALLGEVYEETLTGAEDLSPYARRMLEKSLQESKVKDFSNAKQADIKSMYAEAKVAITNGVNNIANKIMMGDITVEEGLQEFLQKYMSQYIKVLGYDANVATVGAAFQEFCSSYINFLLSQGDKSPEQIEQDVNAFISSMQNKKISFLDAEGNIAKNSEGEEMSFQATIDPGAAEQGRHSAMSLRAKGEAESEYKLSDITKAFDTTVGYSEILSTGSSGSFSGMTSDDVLNYAHQQMKEIDQNNFKDSKVAPAKNEIYEKALRLATLKDIQILALTAKDIGVVRAYANRLKRDLALGATNRNWAEYALEMGKDKVGLPFARLNAKDYNMPQTTNAQAYEHWRAVHQLLEKTLEGCTTIKDLNVKCSSTLRQQSANTAAAINSVEFVPNSNKISPNYSSSLNAQFKQAVAYSEGKYDVAPSDEVNATLDVINGQSDLSRGMAVADEISRQADLTGYSAQFIRGLNDNIGTGNATASQKLLALAMLGRRDTDIVSKVQGVIGGNNEKSIETVAELLSSNVSVNDRKVMLQKLDKKGVPKEYRQVVMAAVEAYAAITGKEVTDDNLWDKIVKTNFVDFGGASGVQGRIFVGHPAFGTGDRGYINKVSADLIEARSRIKNVSELSPYMNGRDMGFVFDDTLGQFILTNNGQRITLHTTNKGDIPLGISPGMLRAMNSHGGTGSDYIAALFGFSQLAQGDIGKSYLAKLQDKVGAKIDPLSMNQVIHASLTALMSKSIISKLAKGEQGVGATIYGASPEVNRKMYPVVKELLKQFLSGSNEKLDQKSTKIYAQPFDKEYQSPIQYSSPNPYFKSDASDQAIMLAQLIMDNSSYCGKINVSKSDTYSITKSAVLGDDVSLNLAAFNHDGNYIVS